MHLYFHITKGPETKIDDHGIEVADVEFARVEVLKAIEDLRREDRSRGEDWNGWRLDIADASGTVLASIDLSTH
jgi:hypothetical protein